MGKDKLTKEEMLEQVKAQQEGKPKPEGVSTTLDADLKPLSNEDKLNKLKSLLNNQGQQPQQKVQSDKPLTNEEKLAKLKGLLSKSPQQNDQQGMGNPQVGPSGLPPFVEKVVNKGYHVFIGTPCYGGMCYINYVVRLLNTQQLLAQLGIQCSVEFMRNESLITRARNNMTAKFMVSPATHLLFIDADITWNPMDVVKLLAAEKDVVGGIYPKKRYAWERLTEENIKDYRSRKNLFYNKDKTEEDLIRENLVNYNLNYDRNSMKIENNILEVYTIATGFFLISRNCVSKMMENYPNTKYVDDVGYLTTKSENDNAYALFDCIIVDTHYFSEDWTFCERWRKIGGKVYCDLSIALDHSGTEDFRGRVLSSLVIQ
jgi:hypothetical protein